MTRCSLCPCTRGRNPIPYHGPTPCRILFILEAPAATEDKYGTPACGKTGMELDNHYLALAGLFRENVGVTNSVICSQPSYRNPTPEEARICSSKHLPALLDKLRPQIIIPMGAVACSLFPSVSLMLHHGIPQKGELLGWEGIVMPMFHPSAGLHATAYMIPLRRDFEALGRLIKELDRGTFTWPQDPYPTPDYQVIHNVREIEDYVLGDDYTSYICGDPIFIELGTDTESAPDGSPYCLTFSRSPGTGRLIYSSDQDLIQFYGQQLTLTHPLLHFHAYLHDLPVYSSMSLPIPRFSDTMIRAYNCGLGGGGDEEEGGGSGGARGLLGLKTLAYRHLNMEMPSFKDVVLPHTVPHVIDWLDKAYNMTSPGESVKGMCECGHEQEMHQERGKTGRRMGPCQADISPESPIEFLCECPKFKKAPVVKQDKTISALSRKVNTLMKALKDGKWAALEKPVDPWKRVEGWHEWEGRMLVDMLGEMPRMDVRLVPEGELVNYAVRDADATLRLNRFLDRYRIL